ncbi:MAG: DUF551 domain-containing protein [Alloprevotella sp.]
MTREEIINQGRPSEPYCFETDREEQWYKAGLYEGAIATPWHDVKEELPDINIPVLVLTHSGNVVTTSMYIPRDANGNVLGDKEWKGNYAFKRSITHWMEIPKLPE